MLDTIRYSRYIKRKNMFKRNYAAWSIDKNKFSHQWSDIEKLLFFARYAILAPSGHNTQPWKLFLRKKSIAVAINKAHYLSIDGSGLLSVEPYISLGTFLEVYNLAAKGFGYELKIQLFPDEKHVAEIMIKSTTEPRLQLLDAITTRVSNREQYKSEPVAESTLAKISSHDFSGVASTLVNTRSDIDFVANQTRVALESIMSNSFYRKELSKWVRTNHTRKYDGMPGFTHGFGDTQSLVSKMAVRYIPKHGPGAKKSEKLIQHSGALIIVCCSNEQTESFINAGRLYSQLCVMANSSGLATSALGASVLDSNTRELMKQHFNIQDRPIYIIRLGKAFSKAEHSPRWPLEKIISR